MNAANPTDFFNKKTLSYTYENGMSFTNYFDGRLRISTVEVRGELREKVTLAHLGDQKYYVAWEDEEMGPISQVFDFANNRLWAAVPWKGEIEIWPGVITAFK